MEIDISWKGPFSGAAQKDLGRKAKSTLKEFFKHCDAVIGKIELTALDIGAGGKAQEPVKIRPLDPTEKRPANTVPVMVFIQGAQGLSSNILIDDKSYEQAVAIIKRGPYKKRKALPEVKTPTPPPHLFNLQQEERPAPTPVVMVTESEAVIPPLSSKPACVKKETHVKSAYEKLLSTKTPLEEIERLKATLASIVYRQFQKDGKEDNTIQVSVEDITKAIMEHMKLPYNLRSNYQGIIGNFYNARISMFAVKWNTSLDKNALYTDWLVDRVAVLDFIGGKNELACLTKVREQEVRARLEEEEKPKEPPPTAEKVEEAVRGGFLEDTALLDMARKTLEGKRVAEGNVAIAKTNEDSVVEKIDGIKKLLVQAEADLAIAQEFTRQEEMKLKDFEMSPEIMEKIRSAKKRIDTLMRDLGI